MQEDKDSLFDLFIVMRNDFIEENRVSPKVVYMHSKSYVKLMEDERFNLFIHNRNYNGDVLTLRSGKATFFGAILKNQIDLTEVFTFYKENNLIF